ncbi:MAG: hypothetical protein A4E71_01860 [Smithella sp. PtaU1.Bin162]|nr:MAG: hypothetical protein A4E71_01860 [Smithella sp. PtaU1.Bin162]
MTQVETENGRDEKTKIFSPGELKNTKPLQSFFELT